MTIASFCTRCGAPNPSGTETCSACGASLRLALLAPAPAPPPPPPGLWATAPIPLKRATVGTILGDTFSVFGKDFATYVLVYLLYGAASTGLSLTLSFVVFGSVVPGAPGVAGFSMIVLLLVFAIVIGVVDLVLASIVTASITHFAVQRYRGTPASLGDAFRVGGGRFLSVLGASLAQGLLLVGILAVGLAVIGVGAMTFDLALVRGGLLLMLALFPIAIYVAVALSLFAPAIVVEGRPAIDGLRRSWALTRGRRLTLFLVLFVLAILVGLISVAASLPFALIPGGIGSEVGSVIATAITGSWFVIMAAVAFHLIVTEPSYSWVPPPYVGTPSYAPPVPPGPPRP